MVTLTTFPCSTLFSAELEPADIYRHKIQEQIIIIIIIIITAIEFSLGISSHYTSTDKTNNIHKRNNTKTQYIQVHILP